MSRQILGPVLILLQMGHPGTGTAQVFQVERYTLRQGIPLNWVTTISQDSQARLWVGGDGGIAVYDGLGFKNIDVNNGLPRGHVWTIVESRLVPGRMYIGTDGGGLSILENDKISTVRLAASHQSNVVAYIIEDQDGLLWCGTNQGLYRIEYDTTAHVTTVFDSGWVSVAQTRDGLIWISVDTALYHFRRPSREMQRVNFPPQHVSAVIEDEAGDIWVTTSGDGTVHQMRGGRIVASRKLLSETLRAVVNDRSGYLWFVTVEGIFRVLKKQFPDGQVVRYTAENGLPESNVFSCFLDRENNLWFGGSSEGLFKISDPAVFTFGLKGLKAFRNRGVAIDNRGRLFAAAGHEIWEIWKDKDGVWHQSSHGIEKDMSFGQPKLPQFSRDSLLWVGFENGGLHGYSMTTRPEAPSALNLRYRLRRGKQLPDADLAFFMIDRHNQLWYIPRDIGGTTHVNLNTMKVEQHYSIEPFSQAGAKSVSCLLRDNVGRIWFGSMDGGIYIFEPAGENFAYSHKLTTAHGLSGNQIRSMLQRRNGEIWIGTRYNGISVYKDGEIEVMTSKDGLLNDAVWTLTEDLKGRVWIATSFGIQHTISADSRHLITPKAISAKRFAAMGFLPGQSLFWGAAADELVFYKHDQSNDPVPIPINILNLRINGKNTELEKLLELTHGPNLYEIDFMGVSLRDERSLSYRYRLTSDQGMDWQGSTRQRMVQYNSLQPGKYSFEVRAVTSDGTSSPRPASLTFTILPPVWQRPWFIMLALLIVTSVLYSLHRLRLQRVLAIEKIRSRIATDLHDDIGAGLTHIGLLSEVALRQSRPEAQADANANQALEKMSSSMARVGAMARELSSAMSDVVWSVNPQHDSIAALFRRLKAFANTLCQAKGIRLNMQVSERIFKIKLNPEARRNLLLIAKEALHNMAKYSGSESVDVRIETDGPDLVVEVADCGCGFSVNGMGEGNGLHNMRSRAEKLGGVCEIESEPGRGTRVKATVPYG